MGNASNIASGINGGGSDGTGLTWWANAGTVGIAPTDSTTALNAALKDGGLITEDGLSIKFAESTKEIKAYGSPAVQRSIVTDQKYQFSLKFLETNAISQSVFHRQAIGGITPTVGTGAFALTSGTFTRRLYTAVFDIIDGANHIRAYCPSIEVTGRQDVTVGNGNEISWGVDLTAYPVNGVAIQWYFLMAALA